MISSKRIPTIRENSDLWSHAGLRLDSDRVLLTSVIKCDAGPVLLVYILHKAGILRTTATRRCQRSPLHLRLSVER